MIEILINFFLNIFYFEVRGRSLGMGRSVRAGKLPSHTICFRLNFQSSRPIEVIWFLAEQGTSLYHLLQVKL